MEEYWAGNIPVFNDWHPRTPNSLVERGPTVADASESQKKHQIRGYFITAELRPIEMEVFGRLGTEVHALLPEINHHY